MKPPMMNGEATQTKKFYRRGPFLAEVTVDGNLYRFAIRDDDRMRPTIHGAKKSLHETEEEVTSVLDRLWPERSAA